MKSLVLMMVVVAAPVWAQQSQQIKDGSSCTPEYVVLHEACLPAPTGQTAQVTEKIVVRPREQRVSRNAADITRDYCQAATDVKIAWAKQHNVPVESVQIADGADNIDTREPWADGTAIGSYRKIMCTFTALAPEFKNERNDKCAIESTSDKNNCFKEDPVQVAAGTVEGCLKMRPSTEAEFWIKSSCLIDAYQAAMAGRLAMSADQAKAIEGSLYFTSKASPSDHLTSYIQTEMSRK